MDSTHRPDQKVVLDGRKNKLEGVEVPLREQIAKKLRNKLEKDHNIGQHVSDLWNRGNADREGHLERQRAFLQEYDEFLTPIYDGGSDWGSALHLPIALTILKTFHARMYTALMSIDPPFTVSANKAANVDRAELIQGLMQYTVKSWVNKYKGIEEFADRWLWRWAGGGSSIAKVRWHTEYTRFVDVEDVQVPDGVDLVQGPDGQPQAVTRYRTEQQEVDRLKKSYDCPVVEYVPLEDLLIVGGDGDPQTADHVIHQCYMTASELWTKVDQGIYDKKAVEAVIASGRNRQDSEAVNQLKMLQSQGGGEASLDKDFETTRYQILEAHMRIDVDGSGIASDIIVWTHKDTREVLRATYLHRVMPTGKRPFYKADFHLREGSKYGVGLIELTYSLCKEIDAMHNINVDIGIITSQPFGFYKPTSSMATEKFEIEPGMMLPLDNPQTDVSIPQFGARTGFGMQEMGLLYSYIERLTGISDITYGVIGGQGATRTATGTRALVNESNSNLDIYIRRMNRPWRGIITHIFEMMQDKIEPGFQFRILGDDGSQYWAQIESPQELAGSYDFVFEGNSANSNPQIQVERASQLVQLTSNPLDLQLGIVTPSERYEALKNYIKQLGVKDYYRFVRKPQNGPKLAPIQIADKILAGVPHQFQPDEDLQGFIALVEEFMNTDELGGQLNQQQMGQLVMAQREAAALLQAMEQQQAQASQIAQQAANSQASTSTQSSAPQIGQAPPPAQGDGG